MVKHTQTIRWQITERLSAYNYFIVQSASKKKIDFNASSDFR